MTDELERLRAENERLRAVLESADVFCSGIICFRGMTSEIETAAMRSEIRAALKSDAPDKFISIAELAAAIKDPRYKSDPAYRDEVQRKLARSNILGRRPEGDQP